MIPQLQQKSVIVLKMGGSKTKQQLEAFVEETKKLQPLKHIKIEMSTRSPHLSFSNEKDIGCEKELEHFNDILQYLAPSLESLEIGENPYNLNEKLANPYRSPFVPR